MRVRLGALALLVLCLPCSALASDAALEAELSYVGPGPGGHSIYRYDYTLTNVAVTPSVIELLVFFDSDPDSGVVFLGDNSDFTNGGLGYTGAVAAPSGWTVDVFEDPDPAPWVVDFFNGAGNNSVLPGASLSGFSVTFLWKGSGVPGMQFFEALDGFAHEGTSTITNVNYPPISGMVTSACTGAPLGGVSVDLFNQYDELLASTLTAADGSYEFLDLPPGDYYVSISTPIGYEEPGDIVVVPGEPADFNLLCLETANDPRTIGFWKHQVNVHLTGKGKAQVPYASFIAALDAVTVHFAENGAHPVLVYTVPTGAPAAQKLQTAQGILTVNGGQSMDLRARQQLMALLLNVTSLKLAQTDIASADGATVSQAITYAWDLIAAGSPAGQETAKDIADILNNGGTVPAGIIPLGTPVIAYSRPGEVVRVLPAMLGQNFPNPMKAAGTAIPVHVAEAGRAVLEVFDVQGRRVRTVLDAFLPGGETLVPWDGRDDGGTEAARGVYFYRLTLNDTTSVKKLVKEQ